MMHFGVLYSYYQIEYTGYEYENEWMNQLYFTPSTL